MIKYRYGMRQGDNLVPILFIIVMQLIAEDIIKELILARISLPKMLCSPNGQGMLKLHRESDFSALVKKNHKYVHVCR